MFVRFADGTEYECLNPIEQKNSILDQWQLIITLIGIVSSIDFDASVSNENIHKLELLDADKNLMNVIEGYNKISSAIIRHGEDLKCEVHLSRVCKTEEDI